MAHIPADETAQPWGEQPPVDVPADLVAAVEDAFDAITEALVLDASVPLFAHRAAPVEQPSASGSDPWADGLGLDDYAA
jgi:hypothetical protein